MFGDRQDLYRNCDWSNARVYFMGDLSEGLDILLQMVRGG